LTNASTQRSPTPVAEHYLYAYRDRVNEKILYIIIRTFQTMTV
jgi:hypothetical protein